MFKSQMQVKKFFNAWVLVSVLFFVLSSRVFGSHGNSLRWFPVQGSPEFVLKTKDLNNLGKEISDKNLQCSNPQNVMHILAQSVSGLAAKAVNQGKNADMVWIERSTTAYQRWYQMTKQRLGFKEKGVFDVWELVEHFKNRGVVKGYILYTYDSSKGGAYTERENIDTSLNVATTMAGLKDGVLVEESMESIAKKLGLEMLFDARKKDMNWCYDNIKDQLNRNMLLTVDPKVGFNRAIAIANKCPAVYDVGEITRKFSEWINPPAPVLGWNCGDESEQTGLVTEYGHFQTATNWALNLPLLSADSESFKTKKLKFVKPDEIDWQDDRHPATFIMSDGDNVQWLINSFSTSSDYWQNQYHGRFAVGWTLCPGHLAQLSPVVLDYLSESQPENAGFLEYGAGYYYPDLFANKRENRLKYLKIHARRISHYLELTGVRVYGFICRDIDSPEAMEAYEVYARNLKGIYGMISFQYYPYDGGGGKVYWFENADGIEIPVVTATQSIWANAAWQGGGTPAKVARLINEDAGQKGFSLAAVHAWSRFKKSSGMDEQAENLAEDACRQQKRKAERGLTPVKWCVDRLEENIQVVKPGELIWRIRMKYRPEQTKKLIKFDKTTEF